MLSRRKQVAINLMITTFFVTASMGISYAANSGGTTDTPYTGDYTGKYVASAVNDDTNDQNVKIDTDVIGNVHGGYNDGTGDALRNKVTISAGTINDVCGGIADTGNADNNSVTISAGTINNDVYGGLSYNGNTSSNSVTISAGTINNDVYGGNSVTTGNTDNNSVTISGGAISGNVHGGYNEDTGHALSNKITISGGNISKNVFAGYSENGNSDGNTITISNGTISEDVFAGYSKNGNSDGNTVTISGGAISGNVHGGYNDDTGHALSNKITISAGAISEDVFAGYSKNGNSDGNILNISGTTTARDISAGVSITGSVTGNTINISGGNIRDVSAGISSGNAKDNIVNIYNGTTRDVSGGISYNSNAENNRANIFGGTITNIFGGYSDDTGSAKNNIVHISGGTISENIFGGYSVNGAAINNTVIIKGNPNFAASSVIYGGHTTSSISDVLTGNKLEVYRSTNSAGTHAVKGIENFSTMNFYLGNNTKNGDIILKVTDEVKLDKTAIGVDIVPGEKPQLVAGDRVTLLESAANFTTTPKSQTVYAGLARVYALDFFQEEKSIGVKLNKVNNNSKVRSLPVAQMTGQSMLKMGGDTIAEQGMTAALIATTVEEGKNPNSEQRVTTSTATTVEEGKDSNSNKRDIQRLSTEKSFLNSGAVFATMGGGTSKYKTNGTSDVNSFNIVTGMAWRINQPKNNKLLLGAFFESGWGNYTTNNSFAEGNVRGDGSSDYMGAGIMSRYEFASGTYVEGSVRMGRVKNNYHSDDLRGAGDARVGYNTSDSYTGAHLGLGYRKKINAQTELDLYGKYLYTHQSGSSVTVVGDKITFDPTNSHRLRLGARLAQKTTKDFNGYIGLAYEYEFDGKMGSSINYNPILAPSARGSSGIIELGVIFKPTNNKNLSIDLSVNGHVGKSEGISGNLQLKYLF